MLLLNEAFCCPKEDVAKRTACPRKPGRDIGWEQLPRGFASRRKNETLRSKREEAPLERRNIYLCKLTQLALE